MMAERDRENKDQAGYVHQRRHKGRTGGRRIETEAFQDQRSIEPISEPQSTMPISAVPT